MVSYTLDECKQIIDKVKELAAKYPDAISETSDYQRGEVLNGPTEKGCIIGQAIRALGLRFPQYNFAIEEICADKTLGGILAAIQYKQDMKIAWGKIV